jgi:hypothetical protein
MTILNTSWPFATFYGHLVCFADILVYIFPDSLYRAKKNLATLILTPVYVYKHADRMTGCVCEKVDQNEAQSVFVKINT